VGAFDSDPDFPDRIMGWACFRLQPWHLAGFFVDTAHAHALRGDLGADYVVRHGTKRSGSDDFKWYREEDSDHNGMD